MIDLADLKRAIRLEQDNVYEDDYLSTLEVNAVAWLEAQTGRYFGAADAAHVEWVYGTGTRSLWLADTPSAVNSVAERSDPGVTSTAITNYQQRGRELVREDGDLWMAGYEYEVDYDRGYAAGAEPADVRQAVIGLVVEWFENRLPSEQALRAEVSDSQVWQTVHAYRQPWVGA